MIFSHSSDRKRARRPHLWSFSFQPQLSLFLLLLLLGASTVPQCQAYRMGDAVDTDLQLENSNSFLFGLANTDGPRTSTTLRSQMPKFGITTLVDFSVPSDQKGFTLLFEDGLRTLEHVPYQNNQNEALKRVTIQFVYSKSGAGLIHSVVLAKKEYSALYKDAKMFKVKYEWIEEAPVRLMGGYGVLFFLVFVTSLLFLMHTCILDEGLDAVPTSATTSSSTRPPKVVAAYGGYRKER